MNYLNTKEPYRLFQNAVNSEISVCAEDYCVEREAKSGKGYCDYLFFPKKSGKPAIILELKVDDTCAAAINQMKEKNYIARAKERAKDILLVGISYDKELFKNNLYTLTCLFLNSS